MNCILQNWKQTKKTFISNPLFKSRTDSANSQWKKSFKKSESAFFFK